MYVLQHPLASLQLPKSVYPVPIRAGYIKHCYLFCSYLVYANFSFCLYLFCLYRNKILATFWILKAPHRTMLFFFTYIFTSKHTWYICMNVSMYNFASLATKSVAWAPSQRYNIVVECPVPNLVRNIQTSIIVSMCIHTYIVHMCTHAHTRTGYVHMYACTCVLTTPHKSQTKENHHTKKNARGEHRKQGK